MRVAIVESVFVNLIDVTGPNMVEMASWTESIKTRLLYLVPWSGPNINKDQILFSQTTPGGPKTKKNKIKNQLVRDLEEVKNPNHIKTIATAKTQNKNIKSNTKKRNYYNKRL